MLLNCFFAQLTRNSPKDGTGSTQTVLVYWKYLTDDNVQGRDLNFSFIMHTVSINLCTMSGRTQKVVYLCQVCMKCPWHMLTYLRTSPCIKPIILDHIWFHIFQAGYCNFILKHINRELLWYDKVLSIMRCKCLMKLRVSSSL